MNMFSLSAVQLDEHVQPFCCPAEFVNCEKIKRKKEKRKRKMRGEERQVGEGRK
jgi:hypothetical protein